MVPWFIAWPLRKAAILPIAGISFAALGAAYGSFKITKNAVLVMAPLPKGKKPSTGSTWTASAAALTFAGAIVGIRELAFAPKMPPSPDLPIEGVPLQVQLRNATVKAMHSIMHYPYTFRFTTAFVAGAAGGLAYTLTQRLYLSSGMDEEGGRGSKSMVGGAGAGGVVRASGTSRATTAGNTVEESDTDYAGQLDDNNAEKHDVAKGAGRPASSSSRQGRQPGQQQVQWAMVYDDGDDDHVIYYPAPATQAKPSAAGASAGSKGVVEFEGEEHGDRGDSYSDSYAGSGNHDPYGRGSQTHGDDHHGEDQRHDYDAPAHGHHNDPYEQRAGMKIAYHRDEEHGH